MKGKWGSVVPLWTISKTLDPKLMSSTKHFWDSSTIENSTTHRRTSTYNWWTKFIFHTESQFPLLQNYRIMKVEGDLGRSSPRPWPKQNQQEQVAQGHVQLGTEYLQGCRLSNIFGQAVSLLSHLQSEKAFFLYLNGNSVFQFVRIASCPLTGHHWTNPGSVQFAPSLEVFIDTNKNPLSLLQAK